MLGSVDWYLLTDVSEQPTGSMSKGEALFWHLKMGTIGCTETSVAKYQFTLLNILEEKRSYLHHIGGQILHTTISLVFLN